MTDELLDSWETSSGLPLDGATVTITEASFGFSDRLPGRVAFLVTFAIEESGEEREEVFTVGGQAARASSDGMNLLDVGKISGRSNYGRLVNAARDLIGDEIRDVIGSAMSAEGWVGTKWVCGIVEEDTENPETGAKKTSSKTTFVEYLGKEGEKKTKKRPAKKAAAKAEAVASDHPDWDALVELAGEYEDHDEFIDAATEQFPDAESDPALRKALYGTGADSVWAAK